VERGIYTFQSGRTAVIDKGDFKAPITLLSPSNNQASNITATNDPYSHQTPPKRYLPKPIFEIFCATFILPYADYFRIFS
jgi:hypothetical protein